jgi:hypothetical protein
MVQCDRDARKIKKREGLAMGRYRYRCRLPPNVKWVKEGEFAIVLGSPVGNDVNHEGWWKKKLAATQGRAQRFIGLFRASYFGRNAVVNCKRQRAVWAQRRTRQQNVL